MSRTTGTKAERDDVRLALGGFGASVGVVAAELQRRFGLRPREAFRQAHDWTQDQAASKLNALGTELAAFTGARISDYERWPFGGRRPSVAVLSTLADVYETSTSSLVDLDDLANMPPGDRAVLGPSLKAHRPAAPGPAREVDHGRERPQGIPLSQRVRLENETDLVIAVTERVQDFGSWSESTNVGPTTLDDIAASTRRIARDYLSQPPLAVYGRAGALADRVFWLLQTGHQPLEQSRELYRWAGYLCSLLAWMAGDLGHPAAAESQIRIAWTCAEPAADPTLRAWVQSTMSKIYLWDQRYEEAASAAARGFEYAPQGTAAIMLACQEADAWAEIGAGDLAEAALRKAEEARQHASQDVVGGLFACNPLRQHNYAGAVQLRIGNSADAIDHANAALSAADSEAAPAYGTVAQVRIWAATAHLKSASDQLIGPNGVEGAAEILGPVLALPPEQRLDTVVRRLRGVGRLLGSNPSLRGSLPAKSLHSEISSFCLTGSTPQLPA
ncbi:helix-turn-helix transcriptional regulator [Actinoplanes sp. NPDC049118]|uniref:helix-turn-helix domain-containing protein n=1 Tax=Actinoplanes sp. NPDC049118 TaxID=3155769 RepID=UPI0033DCBEDC